ncbi:MAG TPA: MBL fold metallo-hydrolase [Ilumatobacter sp.]
MTAGGSTIVTITGTGCPVPSPDRAGPGVLVRSGPVALQFDAGRSTVQRLAQCGLWPNDLTALFVTHHHSDHLTGLADLVLTRWVMDRSGDGRPLPIVAPTGPATRFVERMLDPWIDDIAVRNEHTGRGTRPDPEIVGFDLPSVPTVVWQHDDVTVSAMQVRHEPVPAAVGYRIDTPHGRIAITGDTLVCDEVAMLAEGADVLVYEAMRFEPIEQLPAHRRFVLDYHADTRLIGTQAAALGVGTLVLTHLIPEPVDEAARQRFVADVRGGGFDGTLIVADDLASVTLPAGR